MASKKKAKKKAAKSKKARTTGGKQKVRLHVFVNPVGQFADNGRVHPGIAVPQVLLALSAAASKAKVSIGKNDPILARSAKLRELLDKLHAKVAPRQPRLTALASPSCWDEKTKHWVPGNCPAANAVFASANYALPNSPTANWEYLVGLQLEAN